MRRGLAGAVLAILVVSLVAVPAVTASAADPPGTVLLAGGHSAPPASGSMTSASSGGTVYDWGPASVNGGRGCTCRYQGVKPPGTAALIPLSRAGWTINGALLVSSNFSSSPVSIQYRNLSGSVSGSRAFPVNDRFVGATPTGWLDTTPGVGGNSVRLTMVAATTGARTDLGAVPGVNPNTGSGYLDSVTPGTAGAVVSVGENGTQATILYVAYAHPGVFTTLQHDTASRPLSNVYVGATVAAWAESPDSGATIKLVRAPLSGAAAQETTIAAEYYTLEVAATSTQTGILYYTKGTLVPAFATYPAVGGAPAVNHAVPAVNGAVVSDGTSFLVQEGTTAADSGVYSLARADSPRTLVRLWGSGDLIAGATAVTAGRAGWVDNARTTIPVWSRTLTNSGSTITAGPQTLVALHATGYTLSISGQRSLFATDDFPHTDSKLWLATPSAPQKQLASLPGLIDTLKISGTRALYRDNSVWTLTDIVTGTSQTLPSVGDAGSYALNGNILASVLADGSVYWQDLAGGPTHLVTGPVTVPNLNYQQNWVVVGGTKVAWSRQYCDPNGCSSDAAYADVRAATPAVPVPDAGNSAGLLMSGGYLVYTGGGPNMAQRVALRLSDNAKTIIDPADGVSDLSGSTIALGDSLGLPKVAPLPRAAEPPLYLGNGITPPALTAGSWDVDLPTSMPLTSCSFSISSGVTLVRSVPCDPTLAAQGEAVAAWNGANAAGFAMPSGTYSWKLVAGNADGVVRDVDGTTTPITGTMTVPVPSGYTATGPCRLLDTRTGTGTCAGAPTYTPGPVGAGVPAVLKVKVTGFAGIPANATAVVLNLTAVGASQATFVTAYPDGKPRPGSSTLNVNNSGPVPNLAIVSVGDGGYIDLYNSVGTVHVLADISGYFVAGSGDGSVTFPPCRVYDTRVGHGACTNSVIAPPAPVGAGESLAVKVTGVEGVPDNATAVVLNITAVGATLPTYVSAYPAGGSPSTSSLNVNNSLAIANLVIVPVGAGGVIDLYNARGSVQLIVDISGYFAPGAGSQLSAALPCRVYDTRLGHGTCTGGTTAAAAPVAGGTSLKLRVAGVDGVPADATSVAVNITAVGATTATFITAYPDGGSVPGVSNINVNGPAAVPNLAIVPIGSDGYIDLYNAKGSVQLIVDITGYFAPAPP